MATKKERETRAVDQLADVLLKVKVVSRPDAANIWAKKLAAEGVTVTPPEPKRSWREVISERDQEAKEDE